MLRVCGKITKKEKIKEIRKGQKVYSVLRVKVEVKGKASKNFKFKGRLKKRKVWIERTYLCGAEPKEEEEIILSAQETQNFFKPKIEEVELKNPFLKVKIIPALGARIGKISYKGNSFFAPTFDVGEKEFIEYGGSYESMGEPPGELWNEEFDIDSKSAEKVTLKLKKKRVEIIYYLAKDLPILYGKFTTKQNKKYTYEGFHRVHFLLDEPLYENNFYLRFDKRWEEYRFYPWGTWFRFRGELGYNAKDFFLNQEKKKLVIGCIPGKCVGINLSFYEDYAVVVIKRPKKELKKGEEMSVGFLYAVGEKFIKDKDGWAIVSENDKKKILISSKPRLKEIELEREDFEGIGYIYWKKVDERFKI